MHLRRRQSAHRARHRHIPSAGLDHDHVTAIRHILDDQRRQPGKHRTHKQVDIHHKIMNADRYPASPPTTGQ
ncbi:hypothetical protein, partial [Streptomyces sp. NPDC051577]|uniref:hypothetical protein n=1 Tax=Streptomyces sp. NPDC051577 TaxID=3155166 RepID=UPI00343C7E63